MTVLEKIKRCVSLVWDFQEFYGEEDIEDFCSNELHTYPQHDEIMEYFKHIEELEKENAELKAKNKVLDNDLFEAEKCIHWLGVKDEQLTKAKVFIRSLKSLIEDVCDINYLSKDNTRLLVEAEQFLKEVEK